MRGKSGVYARHRAVQAQAQGARSPVILRHRAAIRTISARRAVEFQKKFENYLKEIKRVQSKLRKNSKRRGGNPRHVQEILDEWMRQLGVMEKRAKKLEALRARMPGKRWPSKRNVLKQISRHAAAKFAMDSLAYGYASPDDVSKRRAVDRLIHAPGSMQYIQSPSTKTARQWRRDVEAVMGREEFLVFRKSFLYFYELLMRP